MYRAVIICLLLPVACLSAAAVDFNTSIKPFFEKNCSACHNSKSASGGIDIQALASSQSIQQNRGQWEKILQKVESREMPPKGVPHPDESSIQSVTKWIASEFERTDKLAQPDPGHSVSRRLNRAEYNNTIRDLLAVDYQPAADFPQDDSGYGFDNIASVLSISPLLMEKYIAAAENVTRIAIFGPKAAASTSRYQPPNRRRLEKNSEKEILVAPLQTPPPYTLQDYDITGLGQPSSIHITHRFPAEGDYVFKVAIGHNRPPGWDPLPLAIWVDGKLTGTVEVAPDERNVVLTGDRQATRDLKLHVAGGTHWVSATFLRQFEGVPVSYGAPHPTHRPVPPPLPVNAGLKPPPPDTPDGIKVDWMEISGPFNPTGPTAERRNLIFTCTAHDAACERKIVGDFVRRAFRRPPTDAEVDRYAKLVSKARQRGRSFDEAIALAVEAVLVSPSFLFRVENPVETARPVTPYELASRLSYFLWSSMPDAELMRCADVNTLQKPEVLRAQVARMIQDRKSQSFIDNFSGQWLETRRLESVKPDRERFPDFDDYLRVSMRRETELFFGFVLQNDRSVLDFLNGSYTFLNERLARHYGIDAVRGQEFRKFDLTGTGRRGILTQASVLTVSSYGNRTSPVLRGKWVLENLLNAPPPPPPPDVPNLNEAATGSTASLREQMETHRANAVCASCHSKMDPIGFALENYDAVGAWRTKDGNFPIDASGILPDGRKFSGAEELDSMLAANPNAFTDCLTQKLMTYALGRGLEAYDRRTVKEIVQQASENNYRFSSLIWGIVNSIQFQQRRGIHANDDHT